MSRLTRDRTAETVSRDQILRRGRGQGETLVFPAQLITSRISNITWLILTLAIRVTFVRRRHIMTVVVRVGRAWFAEQMILFGNITNLQRMNTYHIPGTDHMK